MLVHLSIQNIVLIEAADIAFESGLNVLTGETGAGKSILLDALSLALGARSDAGLVRRGAEQGSVTAEFDIRDNDGAQAVLEELELDAEDTLVLRRTLSADGKSRAFANDVPVSANALKRLAEHLLEIHSQHESQGLMDAATHLELLDAYGELDKERGKVKIAFAFWKEKRDALADAKAAIEAAKREEEYLRHMAAELSALDPKPGEEESLNDARTLMMQGEKLATLFNDVIGEISGSQPVAASLRSAQRMLMRSSLNQSDRFAEIVNWLEKAQAEVEEAENAIQAMAQEMAFDPEKLEVLEDRLYGLREASRKYNVPSDGLAALLAEVEAKLQGLDSQTDTLSAMEVAVEAARAAYAKEAAALSKARQIAAKQLEKTIHAELAPLKMASTKFRVVITPLSEDAWNALGSDGVRFEAATNAGVDFAPLAKIASGGELSRFMLACKVVLSRIKGAPTMVFDEIDTGTGGAVADAIGERLKKLSSDVQVLTVTHLPQVAAKGAHHLRITKQEKKRKTITLVEHLSDAERKEELARMLSGADITAEARSAAIRLLKAV